MQSHSDTILLKEIASLSKAHIDLLEKYNLDFYCKGDRTLDSALKEEQVDSVRFLSELNSIPNSEPHKWEILSLIKHLLTEHHEFTRDMLYDLENKGETILQNLTEIKKEFLPIFKSVLKFKEEMEMHLMKEERILFPYISELVESSKTKSMPTSGCHFSTVKDPVSMMHFDHDTASEEVSAMVANFTKIKESHYSEFLINFYHSLIDLQKDLHIHMHLENNVLFPDAIQLESSVLVH